MISPGVLTLSIFISFYSHIQSQSTNQTKVQQGHLKLLRNQHVVVSKKRVHGPIKGENLCAMVFSTYSL